MVHRIIHRCLCSSSSHYLLYYYCAQGLCYCTQAINTSRDLRGKDLQAGFGDLGLLQIRQTLLLLHLEEEGKGGSHLGEHGGDRVDRVQLLSESHECLLCLLCPNIVPVHLINPRFLS
jgi:hypothetical protein